MTAERWIVEAAIDTGDCPPFVTEDYESAMHVARRGALKRSMRVFKVIEVAYFPVRTLPFDNSDS